MNHSKVLLTFKDDDGNFKVESLWATRQGEYYRIDNIPFLAPNIALGDVVAVEEEEGELHFDKLIQPSGHSTIQVVIFDENEVLQVGRELEKLGCTWEGSHIKKLISVDVPTEIDYYSDIKTYLVKGQDEERLSYREACLAHNRIEF